VRPCRKVCTIRGIAFMLLSALIFKSTSPYNAMYSLVRLTNECQELVKWH
jgi:hypothetical protein